ncbi:hypothetical protein K458DRAFT_414576 [Lentithecium fluviatile CBS 122367]|uniref:Capsule polysaccharide biosynthesis protein n=1 Tax=Lentithecium fluviatile CBS 122367 TaxID=1168545 RepID=A0A6G1JEB1_9PLEO|nr:hypothetical protein K458DRAFT_414576 [Lentithecium fluviatile CBS 122367]
MDYPPIPNTSPLTYAVAAPISIDGPLPTILTDPLPPKEGGKNIFAFWHSGINHLPPYLLRNVINWHRRYAPLGWTVYLLDNVRDSPLNVSKYIDTTSPSVVPEAFRKGTLDGGYVAQHTSDLIRYPLLLKYGGVYLDAGILLFGDLDWLWTQHIANPASPYDFFGFTMAAAPDISIVNFTLISLPNNPLIRRAHRILLRLWEGKTNTTGMHKHPLVSHVPLLRVTKAVVVEEEGKEKMVINDEAMTDYAIQIQCMGAAQRWLDEEAGWDGPAYVREKCYLLSMIDATYIHEQLTFWSGKRQHDLFSLALSKFGEKENEKQAFARKIVESVVGKAWCIKLGHGFSAKLFGADTLGMLWRKHVGSDCVEGTYAGWLRWAEVCLRQDEMMGRMKVPTFEPTMSRSMKSVC